MSFCEIFKAFIFTEHFLATASEIYICNVDEELHKKVATIPSFPKMTSQWTTRNLCNFLSRRDSDRGKVYKICFWSIFHFSK